MDSWLWPSVRIALAGVMLVAVIPLMARQMEQPHPDEPSDIICD